MFRQTWPAPVVLFFMRVSLSLSLFGQHHKIIMMMTTRRKRKQIPDAREWFHVIPDFTRRWINRESRSHCFWLREKERERERIALTRNEGTDKDWLKERRKETNQTSSSCRHHCHHISISCPSSSHLIIPVIAIIMMIMIPSLFFTHLFLFSCFPLSILFPVSSDECVFVWWETAVTETTERLEMMMKIRF